MELNGEQDSRQRQICRRESVPGAIHDHMRRVMTSGDPGKRFSIEDPHPAK